MVGMALNNELSEIAQGESAPGWREFFCVDQPSENLRHLDINKIRRVNTLSRMQRSGSHPLRPGRLEHQLDGR